MNREPKKLELSRLTLRDLTEEEARAVQGASAGCPAPESAACPPPPIAATAPVDPTGLDRP
jgi:hypothetical protein